MAFKIIGSPNPKYLAATDILIGDMSDINYEFLLFDRPIILLANEWLRNNFPDIGIKTDLKSLDSTISRSIDKPEEYSSQRKYWLSKTMHKPDGNSSNRVIDVIKKRSNLNNPFFLLIHGDSGVLKTHLDPLYDAIKNKGYRVNYVSYFDNDLYKYVDNLVCVSANNKFIKNIPFGYKVHIDHGVKGKGTTDIKGLIKQYKVMDYFSSVDLHITEGEISYEKTKEILGPNKNRAVMCGYPKADTLLKLNTKKNKVLVCKELGFSPDKLIITYAPAGKYSYPFKQGASLSNKVLKKLRRIAIKSDNNFLIKLKCQEPSITSKMINRIKRTFIKK